MINENDILKLVDWVLLNSTATSSAGLYNGKAGISLSLFDVARVLNDSYISDWASELFKEVFLTKDDDVSFEYGLSGIGYSLLYLIEYKYIEADFEDIFEELLNLIIKQIKLWESKKDRRSFFNNMSVVFFLDYYQKCTNNNQYDFYIDMFLNVSDDFLNLQLHELSNYSNIDFTTHVLDSLRKFIKIIAFCSTQCYQGKSLELYSKLYEDGRFVSDFSLGHHLATVADNLNDKRMKKVANMNISSAIKDINLDYMSLNHKTEILFLLPYYNCEDESKRLNDNLLGLSNDLHIEKFLLSNIPSFELLNSYSQGIPRYLFYWCFKKHLDNGQSIERFKYLIK